MPGGRRSGHGRAAGRRRRARRPGMGLRIRSSRAWPMIVGRIGGTIGRAYDWVADALRGGSRIIDLTDKSDKSHRKGTRDPKKVYALVLHQMACCFQPADPLKRFLSINSHFAIAADGRILQLHPINRAVVVVERLQRRQRRRRVRRQLPQHQGHVVAGRQVRPQPSDARAARSRALPGAPPDQDDGAHPRPRPSPVERLARERSRPRGLVPRRPMGGRTSSGSRMAGLDSSCPAPIRSRTNGATGVAAAPAAKRRLSSGSADGRATLKGRSGSRRSRSLPRSPTSEPAARASTPSTRASRRSMSARR